MARILLDMDGVLCNLIGKWFTTYNQEYGDRIHIDALEDWGPHRIARAGKAIYKYLAQPGFFRDLEPIEGAIDGVRTLLDRGHDVVIVTAARRGHRDKLEWVAEHLPFLPRDNIVFAHRKELVRGELLFDDAPHNLEAFEPYGIPVRWPIGTMQESIAPVCRTGPRSSRSWTASSPRDPVKAGSPLEPSGRFV